MSSKALAWVIEHSQTKGNARLAMLALADAADDEGMVTLSGPDSCYVERWANLSCEEADAAIWEAIDGGELLPGGEAHALRPDARHCTVYGLASLLAGGAQ